MNVYKTKGNSQATFENEVVGWCEARLGTKNLICAQRPISWKSQWAFYMYTLVLSCYVPNINCMSLYTDYMLCW